MKTLILFIVTAISFISTGTGLALTFSNKYDSETNVVLFLISVLLCIVTAVLAISTMEQSRKDRL